MNIFILAGCMAAVALVSVFVGYSFNAANVPADAPMIAAATTHTGDATPAPAQIPIEIIDPPVPAGSIAVPGFERLTARGRMLQADVISNPARNACYFVVSVMLDDGAEVYRSGVLAPGQTVGVVELVRALTPGTYEGAVARYSAYDLETMTPLNGADIAFTLEVLP